MYSRFYDPIVAAQVHKGKKPQQSVVIAIEESVCIGFMTRIPKALYKFATFRMGTS